MFSTDFYFNCQLTFLTFLKPCLFEKLLLGFNSQQSGSVGRQKKNLNSSHETSASGTAERSTICLKRKTISKTEAYLGGGS